MSASLTDQQIPAFAQGAAKKLLIGGDWVPARSGRTFSTKNPSSGTVLTEIAEADPAMPFGGYKMSGYGKELSGRILDEYLNTKAVWIGVGEGGRR